VTGETIFALKNTPFAHTSAIGSGFLTNLGLYNYGIKTKNKKISASLDSNCRDLLIDAEFIYH
jgi:hypothetical protein